MVKAILISGGIGSRLYKYTKDCPKGMLPFMGKPVLVQLVEKLRSLGVDNIVVVRKHLASKIQIPGVRYIDEDPLSEGNMLRGLMHARGEFDSDEDILVCYGDVVVERRLLKGIIEDNSEVSVMADIDWQEYWEARHGSATLDTESFVLKNNGEREYAAGSSVQLLSLGVEDPGLDQCDARYVGILKFNSSIFSKMLDIYDEEKKRYWNSSQKWYQSKNFKKAYMTDFVQLLIDRGVNVKAYLVSHGWLEFDTNEDYERAMKWDQEETLSRFYHKDQ